VTTSNTGPLIPRRRLGAAFKQLREAKGETLQQTSKALLFSPSKLSRIENGSAGEPHPRDVRDLIAHFEVNGDEAAGLEALAEAGRRLGWWQLPPYEFTGEWETFISYESSASRIREFCPTIVPGLLQTPRYAEAVLRAFQREAPVDIRNIFVAGRLERQHQLADRPQPVPRLHIIEETALHLLVGSPDIMDEQLDALLKVFDDPMVEFRVIPFEAGIHEAVDLTTTTIFEFDSGIDSDIVAIERTGYTEFFDRARTVAKYGAVLDHLAEYWLDESESSSFIQRKQQEWRTR
jgi:transcriptional regulator with XRE-family HTH domain